MIFALFGPCCCGKSTFARVGEAKSMPILEVSEIVRLPSGGRAAEASWEQISKGIPDTFLRFGRSYFADQIVEALKSIGARDVIVAGVRILEEMEAIMAVGPTTPIALFASFDVRLERLRSRPNHPIPAEKYIFERDLAEAIWGMPSLYQSVGYDDVIFTDQISKGALEERAKQLLAAAG